MNKGFLWSDSPNAHLKIQWLIFRNILLKNPTQKSLIHHSIYLAWNRKPESPPPPPLPNHPKFQNPNPFSRHLDEQKSIPTSVLFLAYWHLDKSPPFY